MRFKPPHKCDIEKLVNVRQYSCLTTFNTLIPLSTVFTRTHTHALADIGPPGREEGRGGDPCEGGGERVWLEEERGGTEKEEGDGLQEGRPR